MFADAANDAALQCEPEVVSWSRLRQLRAWIETAQSAVQKCVRLALLGNFAFAVVPAFAAGSLGDVAEKRLQFLEDRGRKAGARLLEFFGNVLRLRFGGGGKRFVVAGKPEP